MSASLRTTQLHHILKRFDERIRRFRSIHRTYRDGLCSFRIRHAYRHGELQEPIYGIILGTAALNGGQATLQTTLSCCDSSMRITAIYDGDTNFAGSTSTSLTFQVAQAPTAVSCNQSKPRTAGQSVTLRQRFPFFLQARERRVEHRGILRRSRDSGRRAGNWWQASFTPSSLAVGNHSISHVLRYIRPGPILEFHHQVITAAPTNVSLSSPVNSLPVGQAFTYIATVTEYRRVR